MISVSQSSVKRYLDCPARFWRERFAPLNVRRKEPVTGPLIVGRAVHTVLEALVRAARSARKTGIDNAFTRSRQLANVARMYEGAFTSELIHEKEIDWGRNGQAAEYTNGLGAMEALAVEAISLPISNEEFPFSIDLAPGYRLTGRIDAVLEDGRLIDFKTQTGAKFSPWRWTQEKATLDFQPPIYAAGMHNERGQVPTSFTFLVAEKAPTAVLEHFTVPLTPAHVQWARTTALVVAQAIERGVFPMPDGAPCTRCFLKKEGGCNP